MREYPEWFDEDGSFDEWERTLADRAVAGRCSGPRVFYRWQGFVAWCRCGWSVTCCDTRAQAAAEHLVHRAAVRELAVTRG